MKNYEDRTETKTTTKQVLVSVTCDLCKKDFTDDDWDAPDSHEFTTEVSCKEAQYDRYEGGGGETKTIAFDICPTCFKNELVPMLTARGAEPKVDELWW